jgi:hypothetical protein
MSGVRVPEGAPLAPADPALTADCSRVSRTRPYCTQGTGIAVQVVHAVKSFVVV